MSGRLTIVGTGLGHVSNMSLETRALLQGAEKVLYVVADPGTAAFLETLNPSAESIYRFYDEGVDRVRTYYRMTDYIMSFVRQGIDVCAAFYGHPGVFVFPAHEALILARSEGYEAIMKPAVSAEDCLFADLGIDPGRVGCQSFEVTDFLVHRRRYDPRSVLVLWQIGVIGQIGFRRAFPIESNLMVLKAEMLKEYPGGHRVIVYESSEYVVCEPRIEWTTFDALNAAQLTPISTLVVPPLALAAPDLDMVARLGIPLRYVEERASHRSRYDPLRPASQPLTDAA